ncbi:MAG: pyridoxamine 5'-phosphate oxidase family protein [bacterium]
MKNFESQIVEYINSQRICVLALEMMDGSPHGATVHFAYDESSDQFLFETSRPYRKCEALFGRPVSRASIVIGVDESVMKTLQIDGEARLATKDEESGIFNEVYFKKFPIKLSKKHGGAENVFFIFTPKWWRYTDWTGKEGKAILLSEDK